MVKVEFYHTKYVIKRENKFVNVVRCFVIWFEIRIGIFQFIYNYLVIAV